MLPARGPLVTGPPPLVSQIGCTMTTVKGHMKIPILVPLQLEARALRHRLEEIADVHVIGPRAQQLPMAAGFEDRALVVVAGIAGGLDPELRCGDAVIEGVDPTAALPARARQGRIHTSPAVVSTPAAKTELRRRTGADVVDMEHAVVAERWRGSGVGIVGVRVVADAHDEPLPSFMETLVDERGRSLWARAAWKGLTNPRDGLAMAAMGRRTRRACRSLSRVLSELLPELRNDLGQPLTERAHPSRGSGPPPAALGAPAGTKA